MPSPTVSSAVELAAVDEQRDPGVAEPERREPGELLAERQPELGAADDRVDRRPRAQIVVGQHRVGVRAERRGEGLDALGADREAGGGAVAAEALEMLGAGRERAVQVERAAGAARSLPVATGAEPAISTTGRPKRSTSREATMPITPSCQSSPATT